MLNPKNEPRVKKDLSKILDPPVIPLAVRHIHTYVGRNLPAKADIPEP